MGILTIVVAAEDDELEALGESMEPLVEWSGVQSRGIDTAKVATLHCLLTGDEFDQAVSAYEPVYAADEEGTLVLRLADEAMERLATLDEDALMQVAEELAATEEFEIENWDAEEVNNLVMDLADLARLAESQGQALFVWMHPLTT